MIRKIAQFISSHPKTILLIATLLLLPAIVCYLATNVNYDILTYLPEDLESVQGERILDETFNDAAMAMIVTEDYELRDVSRMKAEIREVDGVRQVMWVDDIADVSIPESMLPKILSSVFYSADGKSTMMMVQFVESGSSARTMQALREIRRIMDKNSFMSGLSAITLDTKELADAQAPLYIVIAIALALIALCFTMRSFALPFITLVSLGYAVLYNMGTNLIMGEISYITQCIAAILQLGVTMDFSVFLIDRYEEEKQKFPDKADAMSSAIQATFVSVSGSSLTTVAGFLALCFMQFTLGLDIGIVMAKGVLLGLVTVLTVLPAFVLCFDALIQKTAHKSFVPRFGGLNAFVLKHKAVAAIVFVLLFVPSFLGQKSVKVYYNMVNSLPQDIASVVALGKLKDEFDMAGTHFILLPEDAPASNVSAITEEIKAVDGVTLCLSLHSVVGGAIPLSMLPDNVRSICVKGGWQLMMVNSEYETASDALNAQIEQITAIVKSYCPGAVLTGEGILTKDLIEVTNRDFTVTNIISIGAIFLLILICFKSVSMPVLLVLAIELAIMINESISFLTGTEIPFIAPTVIGCVQLGATVDYAMLMGTRFKEELQRGRDKYEAIRIAADESDRSIFQSASVFFLATFGVYVSCNISIIRSICALLARGSLISAAVIILCLPSVLVLCEGVINKTSLHWRNSQSKKELKRS
ncbi:MAG: MMPL family transporter [Clostridia bacterium]|nr:MMPL family transporter [Clostridia bacterium]